MTTMMNASRSCSRCRKDLTDAASMECGVGPVCRKLDNALLAQMIPSNADLAKQLFTKVVFAKVPADCHLTLAKIDSRLNEGTNDWRETVKRTEWVLSHNLPNEIRSALYSMVQALGYIGLVSMWLGEAASGKALIAFEAGRLWITGPRNTAGKDALKAIKGRMFHKKTDSTPACWSVPANQADAFQMAVLKHWPNNEGLAEAIIAAKLAPVAVSTIVSWESGKIEKIAPPMVTVDGETLVLNTPYNADFVGALKSTIPYKDRAWNPTTKTWSVKASHKMAVEKMLATFFKAAA